MTPYESYQIGEAAFRNAQEFAEQADLLAERGWHGRALSMAILGQEELGKATYFALLSFGRMRFKPDAIKEMFRLHTSKQRMSQVHAMFESLMENAVLRDFFQDAVVPAVNEIPDDLSAESEERLQTLFQDLRRIDACAAARRSL